MTAQADDEKAVLGAVWEQSGIPAVMLVGPGRTAPLSFWRQIACLLLHEAGLSYPEIGRMFHRHYSTIIYHVQLITARSKEPMTGATVDVMRGIVAEKRGTPYGKMEEAAARVTPGL